MIELSNSWGLARQLLSGQKKIADLEADLAAHGRTLLRSRAAGIRAVLPLDDLAGVDAHLRERFQLLSQDAEGNTTPFDAFQKRVGRELAGIVFTAHPTFAVSEEARRALHRMIAGEDGKLDAITRFRPLRSPTLEEEHDQAEAAIRHARRALRRIMGVLFDTAAEIYPADWRGLKPRLMTLASWVGFDLDGRTDIGWSQSQLFRYRLALAGLEELQALLATIPEGALEPQRSQLLSELQNLQRFFHTGCNRLSDAALEEQQFASLNRDALAFRPEKQAAITAIDGALEQMMADAADDGLARLVGILRTEWHSLGLGLSHIHFRVNAAQLHNAIRPEIGSNRAPDRSANRRQFLAAITELLDEVQPTSVHYGTLAHERTTAKRVFMLAAQFEKHFDGRTPIRMLVAESDTPFTVLTALYYAKLFDVEDHVEISPLFETDTGLQRGDQVIAELLQNKHFVAYIERQGRFCVQLGFSDSGRYIGQMAAGLAIERFKLRLIRLWKRQGLDHIQLLFFDTHGESIGRGTHPKSLHDRFLYTHTPAVRRGLSGMTAPHKHEVSFQGGDGYLWFASEDSAYCVLAEMVSTRLSSRPNAPDDILYDEPGWALDFFLTLKEQQNRMTAHKGYLALIDSIGLNLIYPTGSRALKRQGRGKAGGSLEHIGQLRAIPNNAILQQFGYLANTVVGLGAAVSLSPETFAVMRRDSSRFRRMMNMADEALRRSDLDILQAYLQVMSPYAWLTLAASSTDADERGRMRRLSVMLEDRFDQVGMARLGRDWVRDAQRRDDMLDYMNLKQQTESDPEVSALHEMRIALIQFIYMKAMEVPRFSSRFDISLEDVLDQLIHLEVPDALEELSRIFSAAPQEVDDAAYGETASYAQAQIGYAEEHARIFTPIAEAYDLILRLSSLIGLRLGAFG